MASEVSSFTLIDRRNKNAKVTKKQNKVPKLILSEGNNLNENIKEILKFMLKWTKGTGLDYEVTEDYTYNKETEAIVSEIIKKYVGLNENFDLIPIEKVIAEVGSETYTDNINYLFEIFFGSRTNKLGVRPIIVPVVNSDFLCKNYWSKQKRVPKLYKDFEYKYFQEMEPYFNKEVTIEDELFLKRHGHFKTIKNVKRVLDKKPFEEWSEATELFLTVWIFDRTSTVRSTEDGSNYSIRNLKEGKIISNFTAINLDFQLAMLRLIDLLETVRDGFIDTIIYLLNQKDKPYILSRINVFYKSRYLVGITEALEYKSKEQVAEEILKIYYQNLLLYGRNYKYKIKNTLVGDISLSTFLVNVVERLYKEYIIEEQEQKLNEKSRASVFETKKNISKEKHELMKTTRLLEDFKFVEIDNAVKKEDFYLIEEEWFTIRGILPTGREKPSLRFRKLGNHKANGLYSHTGNILIVDNLGSFLHEYGHYLDYYYTNEILSKQPPFKHIVNRYTKLYGNSYKKEYYTTPQEIFARGFEHYLRNEIGLKSNFLGVRESLKLDEKLDKPYKIIETDGVLNNDIIDYFTNLFTGEPLKNRQAVNKVNRELNEIGYLTVDKEKIIDEVRSKLTKAEVEDLLIDFDNKIDMNLNPNIKVNNKKQFEVVVGTIKGYLDLDEYLTEEFNKYFNYAVMMQTPFDEVVEEVYKIFKIN